MIETVADAVRATRDLQDWLEARGDLQGALWLCKATGAFYSTSSEALIGILQALKQVTVTCKLTSRDRQNISTLESEISQLLDLR